MDTLIVVVLVITAAALVTVFAIKLGKDQKDGLQAVLSPTTQDNLSHHTPEHRENLQANWKFSSAPWNNCLDANRVYCSPSLTRQPGGCLKMRYYPKCGASCNAGCPSACNNCVNGSCQ
jgi:hypothetical protein